MVARVAAEGATLTCQSCHVKEAASQIATPMAHALQRPGNNPLFQLHNNLRFTAGRFTYKIETRGNATDYTVTDGTTSVTLPILWIFGQGAQTYVLAREGQFFESMVSYYPEIGALDITLGDEMIHPQTVDAAVGRKLEASEITECLTCHSTGSLVNHKLDLNSLVPGIACARCHTEAPAHMEAASHLTRGTDAKAGLPERLGIKSAESLSNFCGRCHRTWETVVRNNWRGENTARFQPYRLANSRCFDGADARISCLACHNPHEDLVKNDVSYDSKCLACHSTSITRTVSASASQAKTCPVAASGCVACHMPKVRLPGGHQTFTDHQIRVVKAGEAYPN